jgi:hypothetical protein
MLSARLAESARIFAVSAMRCVVSVVIFMESAILIESAMRALSAAALLCPAFLHAPAAMTTSATTNAIRFMRSPVEVSWGTAKRTQGPRAVKQR